MPSVVAVENLLSPGFNLTTHNGRGDRACRLVYRWLRKMCDVITYDDFYEWRNRIEHAATILTLNKDILLGYFLGPYALKS